MKKILKKSAAALAALTLTAALAGCGSSASSAATSTDTTASTAETSGENKLEKVKAAGKLVIGVEGTYPPFTYHDDNGELTGLDVELGKALAEKLGLRRDQVMAVGDSGNDLSMIEDAGLGIAMGNATPEILAVADAVTADNNHDGVALAIEKYALHR